MKEQKEIVLLINDMFRNMIITTISYYINASKTGIYLTFSVMADRFIEIGKQESHNEITIRTKLMFINLWYNTFDGSKFYINDKLVKLKIRFYSIKDIKIEVSKLYRSLISTDIDISNNNFYSFEITEKKDHIQIKFLHKQTKEKYLLNFYDKKICLIYDDYHIYDIEKIKQYVQ